MGFFPFFFDFLLNSEKNLNYSFFINFKCELTNGKNILIIKEFKVQSFWTLIFSYSLQ